jgi:hypothetical protein
MERRSEENVFELLASTSLEVNETPSNHRLWSHGVMRGVISDLDQSTGKIQIVMPKLSSFDPLVARSIVPVTQGDVGREVLVAFERGEAKSPYIIGLLWEPGPNPLTCTTPVEAKVDGEQVVIEGYKEIMLKCGKASITLTRAGRVHIRGTYVLSRSSGVNRLKGGSVQVN